MQPWESRKLYDKCQRQSVQHYHQIVMIICCHLWSISYHLDSQTWWVIISIECCQNDCCWNRQARIYTVDIHPCFGFLTRILQTCHCNQNLDIHTPFCWRWIEWRMVLTASDKICQTQFHSRNRHSSQCMMLTRLLTCIEELLLSR